MPLNFPDNWGVRNKWRDASQREEPEDDSVLNDDGQMKCPSCGRWVDAFDYVADYTEVGSIDKDGELNGHEMEFDGLRNIRCPECGDNVFDSSYGLRTYYGTLRR